VVYLFVHPPAAVNPYWSLADGLLRDGSLAIEGQKTTVFEPLYPLFVAAARAILRAPLAVDLLQALIAAAGAALIDRLTLALTGDDRVALAAALFYAVDPLLVRESVVRTESALFITLVLAFAAAFVAARRVAGFALAGACLGLAILTRTTALPLLVFAPAVLLARRMSAGAAALFAVAAIVLLPLPLRNHALNGSWLPTRSGINLFIGNCEYTTALLPDEDLDLLQDHAERTITLQRPDIGWLEPLPRERAADEFFAAQARSYIRARPGDWLAQKVRNVWYLLSPRVVPYRVATDEATVIVDPGGRARVDGSRPRPFGDVAVSAASQALLLLFGIAGAYRRRHALRGDLILWTVVATVVGVNVIYVPATRYRAPMEFVSIVYAAASAVGLLRALVDGDRRQHDRQ